MAAGVELAVGYITLAAETKTLARDMGRAFTGVESQAAKSGQVMGETVEGAASSAGASAGKRMGSMLGGAFAVASKATAGAAIAGLGVALSKGFSRLQAIEQAKASLTGLGHSAESVTEIMNNATASVKGTAFGLGDAAAVAASMVAAGIKPGKDLQKTLTLVGDAATIAGTDIGSMGAIFGKAAASNKVQMDVINQLHDAGVPALALLADQMGVTAAEASKMASDGKIDFATFEEAMTKGLGGAAQESGKTLKGAFANTMASVGRIGANLLSGVYPLFTKFFGGLITWMEPLEGKAKVVGIAIGAAMEQGAAAVGGLHDVLVKGDFTTRFREAFNVEEDSKLVDFLFDVREGLIKTAGVIQGAAAILFKGDFVGSSIMGMEEDSKVVDFLFNLREGFLNIGAALGLVQFSSWDAFKSSLSEAGGSVGGAFSSMGESLTVLGPAFAEFGRQLPNITGAFVKLGGVSLNALVFTLGFLADHVDIIIAWMPVIVAGFIAWRIASSALAVSQYKLQVAQAAMAPVLLANNILRYASVRAETALSIAQGQSVATTNASMAATIRARVATVANTAATWATTVAQKAWTVAKIAGAAAATGLGIALKLAMGPVGLIIAGITLLVAGLVWFFTQTDLGKTIVQNAFSAIKSAMATVVDWWNATLVPALQVVGQWFKDVWDGAALAVKVAAQWIMDAAGNIASFFNTYVAQPVKLALEVMGAAFTWLYETIIKPVFDSIFVIANGFYLGFRGIFQLVVAIFKEIIAPAFMDFWHGVVAPVFAAIGMLIGLWWGTVSGIFTGVVTFIRDVLGAVFTWFRDSVITPVLNFILGAVSLWWTATSLIFTTVVGFIRNTLGVAFTWFRDSVITPVLSFILGAVTNWWTGTRLIFDTVVGFLRNTLGVAFTWLRDSIITPVFNGIRDTISNVWNNGIKPVFDFLSKAIREDVPAAFQKGIDGVRNIWDTLLEIAKKPVRFMVTSVINDGLIGAFNKVAGFLPGIDKLANVALPTGFARGGVLPGYRAAKRDDVMTPMRSGEGVLVPEVVKGLGAGFVHSWNRIGNSGGVQAVKAAAQGMAGYAKGGIVNPLKQMMLTQGYNRVHKGIDLAASVGTPVFATQAGTVTLSGPGASAPGVSGGNEIHVAGGGLETWFAHLSQMMVRVGESVRAGQQIGLSGNTGITSGPHLHFGVFNGGWPNDVDASAYLGGAITPSGEGGGGFNPIAALAGMAREKLTSAFPGGGKMVDFAIGTGEKLIGGVSEWVQGKLGSLVDSAVTGAQNVASNVGMRAQWMPMINAALMRAGHGDLGIGANSESMFRRMMQESGGNPRAINNWDSNAAMGQSSRGLMQVIPSTFEAYRDRGLSSDIFDPMANMVAAIRYTKSRYGNLRTGWDQPGGYATGGIVTPTLFDGGGWLTNTGSPQIIDHQRSKPDAVLTNSQWRDVHSLVVEGGGSSLPERVTLQVDGHEFNAYVDRRAGSVVKSADQQSAYSRVGR